MAAGAAAPDQDPGAAAPAAPSAPQPAGAATDPLDSPATPAEPAARQTILVVEDEPALLRALRINLRARGYEVLTTQAGRRPWPRRRSESRTRCILDLGLPDIDGIDLIRELRAGHVRAGHRAVRPDRAGRQDRRPGRGRGRLRDQALLHGGTAGPAARRAAPGRPGAARAAGGHRPLHDRPGRAPGHPGRRAGAAHADRVAAAGDPDPQPGPAGRRPPAAHRGLGARLPSRAPTTCASTWPGCAANWRTTRPAPGTC